MYERFTDRARRVMVLAQEEAILDKRGFIGTEHVLIGLIHEGEGIAASILDSIGIELQEVREAFSERYPISRAAKQTGIPPMTPEVKKGLELGLREALQLGHNYIGTEHILLGLVRLATYESDAPVFIKVLKNHDADPSDCRSAIITKLAKGGFPEPNRSTFERDGTVKLEISYELRRRLSSKLDGLRIFTGASTHKELGTLFGNASMEMPASECLAAITLLANLTKLLELHTSHPFAQLGVLLQNAYTSANVAFRKTSRV